MHSIHTWLLALVVTVITVGCASTPSSTRAVTTQYVPTTMLLESAASDVAVPEQSLPAKEVVTTAPEAPVPPEPEPTATDWDLAVNWMLGFMTKNAPPGRQTFYTEAQETKEDSLKRYTEIANALIEVVYDPNTKPLFKGSAGRARTASVILAVALFESGFMKNVDFGIGKFGRGDNGHSWCMLQLNIGSGRTLQWNTKHDRPPRAGDKPEDIFRGYTGPELVSDRRLCIGEALKGLRLSFNSCPGLPLDQRLRVYGSGTCEGAADASRIRMQAAIKFWNDTQPQRIFKDDAVVAMVKARRETAESTALASLVPTLKIEPSGDEPETWLPTYIQASARLSP